jgi:hypothetical protein
MFSLAENLIQVRLQLIDASGKTYDPNVPNDDLGIGAGLARRSSPVRGSAPTASGCS